MTRNTLIALTLSTATSALAASTTPAARPAVNPLDAMEFVETELYDHMPDFGAELLNAPSAMTGWLDGLTLERVANAAGDVLPAERFAAGAVELANAEGTSVRIDRDASYVRYLSRSRGRQDYTSPTVGVGEDRALDVVLDAVAELDVPLEGQGGLVDVAEVETAINYRGSEEPARTYTNTTLVTLRRQIAGVAVVGSEIRAAVSNDGEIARLRVEWPDFELDALRRTLRSRGNVIDEIIERVVAQELEPSEVRARLVYSHTASGFVPAMEVSVLGPHDAAGFEFEVDLTR